MENKEIEAGNRIIAEWMEIPKCDRCENCGSYKFRVGIYYHPDLMQYNSSWDWIMPVAVKIFDSITEENKEDADDLILNIKEALSNADIEATYLAILDYINWHNNNKK